LHHQLDVAGDLAAGAGENRAYGCRFRDAVAVGVPGCLGQRQLEFLRQPFRNLQSLGPEGGERAGGAAELQCQRLAAQPLQPPLRAMQRRGIFGQLQAERHRQRVLQPGAGDNGRVAMLARQFGKTCDRAAGVSEQRVDAGAEAEHGAGIDHVLAGRPPMDIARGVGIIFGDVRGQCFDEGNREIAGPRCSLCQRRQVE
jgi:hypothetical protein